jgi:hypothetical protein
MREHVSHTDKCLQLYSGIAFRSFVSVEDVLLSKVKVTAEKELFAPKCGKPLQRLSSARRFVDTVIS